jgi:uncharacterized protein YbaP (TraB family)
MEVFVDKWLARTDKIDQYMGDLLIAGKYFLDQRANTTKRYPGVEITEEQVKLFGTKFHEYEWNKLLEKVEDMRSDTKVIQTAIRTYNHKKDKAIVAEAQRLKNCIVAYQHLDNQQKLMKQAFDKFLQQEPELQEILTKKRSVVAAATASIVQPIHSDSKSVNSVR